MISHSTKKIIKRILFVLPGIIIVPFLSLTFIINYRIGSILKEFVRKETNDAYQLRLSKISLSLIKGRVIVKDAEFKPSGKALNKTNYHLRIADLYLSLGSWKQLLFHHKLFVDSLLINRPDIIISYSKVQENNNAPLQIQNIYASLKDISEKLKVHVLELSNGSIDINNGEKSDSLLLINNITFRIENFGQKTKGKTKLRYSDDVVLDIPRQHWIFPSGQTISFKRLFFSGKDQFFQADSCTITRPSEYTDQPISLYADKMQFRAGDLSSIFEKDEINIDTLYFKSPILSFTLPRKSDAKDSASGLNESIHQLIGNIHIQLINIENGQIQLNTADGNQSYMSRKTNLSIYDLDISQDHFPHTRTGNIDLHLDELSFASRDSLYVLNVKEFGMVGNDLVCRNAFLKPSSKNRSYFSGMSIPIFILVDVSLKDLLEKRFKAYSLVIGEPRVQFASHSMKKKIVEEGIPVDKFYAVLNELAQMIDVHWLTIRNGELAYHSPLTGMSEFFIKDINAEINLDNLLSSSTPTATKQSIQSISIESFSLKNHNTNILLKNILLNGQIQVGIVKSLQVNLPSGSELKSENIYWKNFSFEKFAKEKRIDMDSMDIGKLYFTTAPGNRNTGRKKAITAGGISINKLHIRESHLSAAKENNSGLIATANNIVLEQTALKDGIWTWHSLAGKLEDLSFNDLRSSVTIGQMNITTNNESYAQEIIYRDGINLVKIPEIIFQLNLSSSNISSLDFTSLSLFRPQLVIRDPVPGSEPAKNETLNDLIPFRVKQLDVIDGNFNFESARRQISASFRFNTKVKTVAKHNNNTGVILFDKAILNVDSVLVNTEKFKVKLDKLGLDINSGSLSGNSKHGKTIAGLLNGQWRSLSLTKPTKNGYIEIADLTGKVEDFPLSVKLNGMKLPFKEIVERMSLTKGRFFYTDSVVTAAISNINCNGKEGELELIDIKIKPKETLESFLKTSIWQKDYLTFDCKKIVLKKINYQALFQDTAFIIQHVYLLNPRLSAYRDKNIAFQHGIEKLMPTKLMAGLKFPAKVDSLQIKGASIDVHEVSATTKREGRVPLRNINAVFKNLTSRPGIKDSLSIDIVGRVLDYDVWKFRYAESYNDSLSGFRMNYSLSAMHLPGLSEVTNPLSAVAVTSGKGDMLYAKVSGNKHAAFGEMNFYYHNLRIRLLNKEDSLKKSFLLDFETLMANSFVIKSNNRKQSLMFFARDREKFVFNYWVKTLFSGLYTSVGAKSNSKYKKMHDELAERYSLPSANQ
jgi:hypothetical protein